MDPVVVVGAGIAGVACAREVAAAGVPVRLVDRGRRSGGRMAARRLGGRPVDLGASYLTASGEDFGALVSDWESRGLAFAWTDTFAVLSAGEEPSTKSGPVRWGAQQGLRSLVEDLARTGGLEVEHGEVERVEHRDEGLVVDGGPAAAVVLAVPDAQALRVLGAGTEEARARLDRPAEPILALAAWWAERTWDDVVVPGPFHGAFVNGDDALSWIADDGRRRGDDAATLVAHSTPELAGPHLEDPTTAEPVLLAALQRLLHIDPPPLGTHVHRWSLARPTGERDEPFLLTPQRLGVCGDGWGASPKVETAWLSGRQLGRALVDALG